ncbi:amino acid ABC transporter substrate-binding protein [Leucobacter weissii]|uniref:Amino acid ABC transporter substrate-binding protein n=1 Tax=Leucobacter weissii TaxID=1983706 RepID=A0A939MLQ1_9MICO|nr:ABC transporter substrate-binding protein [Leucobacter weissii]MBO1900937.1 amino acid ABC transporter substrate-binding protein [Leucobacter weissii]
MKRRSVLSAVTAAVFVLGLAGCSSADPDGSGTEAETQDRSFTTITEGTLTVGVPEFPPFVGLEGDEITGPDGEIIAALAERYDLELQPEPYEFAALIPAIQQGRIDVAIGSIFRTAERAEVVDFSAPLYDEPAGVISEDGVDAVADFADLRVGTIQGYNWVEDVQTVLGDNRLTLYPSSTELQQDLEAGRIDVGIDSYGTALYLYADSDFTVERLAEDERIATSLEPGQTAFLLSKDNPELTAALDAGIAELHENGLIAEALERAGLDPIAADTGEPRILE